MRHLKLVPEIKKPQQNTHESIYVREALEQYLEEECCFRDYAILDQAAFGMINLAGLHKMIDPDNLESDADNAIKTFRRDGYDTIYFYV